MKHMFYYTMRSPENGTLDISSFDTRSLTQAEGIFNYTKVKTIFASPNFVTTGIPTPQTFFFDSTNLQGGNGTTCIWPNIDSTFAHIDAPGNPGYFTQK